MAEDKATKALKDTNTEDLRDSVALGKETGEFEKNSLNSGDRSGSQNEKIELAFRTYDQYGRATVKRIDVTDLIKENIGNDLKADVGLFVGLKYSSVSGTGETVPAYRIEEGRDLKGHVDTTMETAIVNTKQLQAIGRQLDEFFDTFDRRMFGRFWLD